MSTCMQMHVGHMASHVSGLMHANACTYKWDVRRRGVGAGRKRKGKEKGKGKGRKGKR